MKPHIRLFLAAGALSLAVAAGLPACGSLLSRDPGPVGVVAGRLGDCPESPNCVHSQSAASDAEHAVAPLAFEGDPEAAFERLLRLAIDADGAELVARDPGYAHLVYRTRLMRFADDVEFLLEREARVIHVRSASRVGWSDLGANRARVESLRARFSG
jgi:uncharacterized protein (DUF1499 family)